MQQIVTDTRPAKPGCRLVAVVVTYNRLAQLKITLERLLRSSAGVLQKVVVVDNASDDGTGEWLRSCRDARLDILRSPTNEGGAGGFELGLRHAVRVHDPDWTVVMDDDGRPEPGGLEAFFAAARDPDTAYGAAVRFPGGQICEMNRPGLNPFRRPRLFVKTLLGQGRAGYHLSSSAFDGKAQVPIDMASFVGLFLPRSVIDRCGFPDGGLFLYGDDVIYSLNMRLKGVDILFDPALRFEHDCSTFGPQGGVMETVGDAVADRPRGKRVFTPLWKVYYAYRNGLIMYRKAAGPLFWPLVPVLALKWGLAARRYRGDERRYLRLAYRGILDGVRRRTDLPHDRVRALSAGEGA